MSERCRRSALGFDMFDSARSTLQSLPIINTVEVGANLPLGESSYHHTLSVHQTQLFTTTMARTRQTAEHTDEEAKQAERAKLPEAHLEMNANLPLKRRNIWEVETEAC